MIKRILNKLRQKKCRHKYLLVQARPVSSEVNTTTAYAIRVVCKDCGKIIIHPWQKISKE